MSNSVVDADVAIGDQRLLAARRCNSSAHAHAPRPPMVIAPSIGVSTAVVLGVEG